MLDVGVLAQIQRSALWAFTESVVLAYHMYGGHRCWWRVGEVHVGPAVRRLNRVRARE